MPNSGGGGTVVEVQGVHFGASKGTSTVTFNGEKLTVMTDDAGKELWSDTSITVTIPAAARTGLIVVNKLGKQSYAGNNAKFTISSGSGPAPAGPPNITSVSPTSGARGLDLSNNPYTLVQIIGENFGANRGSSTVRIGGTFCEVVTVFDPTTGQPKEQWSDTGIKVSVPEEAPLGTQTVLVDVGGVSSNAGFQFTVEDPPPTAKYVEITKIEPDRASAGDTVVITGKNFGNQIGSSYVLFDDDKRAQVVSWATTRVEVNVPQNAGTGQFHIVVNDITYPPGPPDPNNLYPLYPMDPITFEVIAEPVITGISPVKIILGGVVTLYGAHFGAQPGRTDITFNSNSQLPPTMFNSSDPNFVWKDDQVSFIMPNDADVKVDAKGAFLPGTVKLTTFDSRVTSAETITVKNAFDGSIKTTFQFLDPITFEPIGSPVPIWAAPAGNSITFEAFAVGGSGTYSYKWDFGDAGGTASTKVADHSYNITTFNGTANVLTPKVRVTDTVSGKVSLFIGDKITIGPATDPIIGSMFVSEVVADEPQFNPPISLGGIDRLPRPNIGKLVAHLGDKVTIMGFNLGDNPGVVEITRKQVQDTYDANIVLGPTDFLWDPYTITFSLSDQGFGMTGDVHVITETLAISFNGVKLVVEPRIFDKSPASPTLLDTITLLTNDTDTETGLDSPTDVAQRRTFLVIKMPAIAPFVVAPDTLTPNSVSFNINAWRPIDATGQSVNKVTGTWNFYVWSNALADGRTSDIVNSGVISQAFAVPIS